MTTIAGRQIVPREPASLPALRAADQGVADALESVLSDNTNRVFSEWERIFANPMATAAAIDRVVHHSVILEFAVPSYRTDGRPATGPGRGGEPAKLIDDNFGIFS